jgi:hypothetical protein
MSKILTIRIKGSVPEVWSDWFEDLEVKLDGEYTIMTGEVPDHPAVHGIIERIRDLNLDLISVNLTDN